MGSPEESLEMTKRLVSILFAACLVTTTVLPVSVAQAETFLKIRGSKQGDIKGTVTVKGAEGAIDVLSVNHEISASTAATGTKTPGTSRQHKPFVITKGLDRTTPLLYKAMVSRELLPEVEMSVVTFSEKGIRTLYKVRLVNAMISKIRVTAEGDGDPSRHISEVSFTYEKIEWTWTDGGITAMDDWESPVI